MFAWSPFQYYVILAHGQVEESIINQLVTYHLLTHTTPTNPHPQTSSHPQPGSLAMSSAVGDHGYEVLCWRERECVCVCVFVCVCVESGYKSSTRSTLIRSSPTRSTPICMWRWVCDGQNSMLGVIPTVSTCM